MSKVVKYLNSFVPHKEILPLSEQIAQAEKKVTTPERSTKLPVKEYEAL